MPHKILGALNVKKLVSPDYNYYFDLKTGFFARWGRTEKDDPQFSPFGPEILDVEIVEGCRGIRSRVTGKRSVCPYCYKKNTPDNIDFMSLDTFVKMFQKVNVNNTVTQVALGLDAEAILNPDTFKISEWLREHGVIPNGTVADLEFGTAISIANLWGAVAVSLHMDKQAFRDTIELLVKARNVSSAPTLKQINCHIVVCEENYEKIKKLLGEWKEDEVIHQLNAIVLLALKHCGRAEDSFTKMSDEHFKEIVDFALDNEIPIGFDSCSANKFSRLIANRPNADALNASAEPCESGLFSYYVNKNAIGFPCSFNEKPEFAFDILNCENFINDYWNKNDWRGKLLENKRSCPTYEV